MDPTDVTEIADMLQQEAVYAMIDDVLGSVSSNDLVLYRFAIEPAAHNHGDVSLPDSAAAAPGPENMDVPMDYIVQLARPGMPVASLEHAFSGIHDFLAGASMHGFEEHI